MDCFTKFFTDHKGPIFSVMASLYIALTVLFLLGAAQNNAEKLWGLTYEVWKYILFGIILLGPPIWFLLEYMVYKKLPENTRTPKFEEFKYNQELTSRIWAAVSAFAAAIVFKK